MDLCHRRSESPNLDRFKIEEGRVCFRTLQRKTRNVGSSYRESLRQTSWLLMKNIQELCGIQPEKIFIRSETSGVFPHKMVRDNYGGAEGFWSFLLNRDGEGCLLGCSIKGYGKEGLQFIEGQPSGLILNHAYGINDVFELTDP